MGRALAAQNADKLAICTERGDGLHRFARCTLCGHSVFVETRQLASPRRDVEYVNVMPIDCIRCVVIMEKHPEIHAWIIGVYANIRLAIENEIKDST